MPQGSSCQANFYLIPDILVLVQAYYHQMPACISLKKIMTSLPGPLKGQQRRNFPDRPGFCRLNCPTHSEMLLSPQYKKGTATMQSISALHCMSKGCNNQEGKNRQEMTGMSNALPRDRQILPQSSTQHPHRTRRSRSPLSGSGQTQERSLQGQ